MRSVAEYVANLRRSVTSCVEIEQPDAAPATLAPSVDRALSLSGATDVHDRRPRRRRARRRPTPRWSARRADLGDSDVREGRGWTGDVDDDGDEAVAGHAPILADDGALSGSSSPQQTLSVGLGAG